MVAAAIFRGLLLTASLLVVLVIARRLAGALVEPLPTPGLLAFGICLAIWAVAAHRWLASRYPGGRTWGRSCVWLPPAVLLAICWALLLPGSSALGAAGLIAELAVAETAAWVLWRRRRTASQRPAADLSAEARAAGGPAHLGDPTEEVLAETVRQRDFDSRETIRGWLRAEFAAGQRTASLHVAFCPALAGRPSCEAEQVEGPPATVRVAQVLPYGARIDVKLEAPASRPLAVRIEFAATAAADAAPVD